MSAPTEQQRDQLLDYLYDALPDADRASLEAALASSEPLRRELAALRETLSMTRKALAETEREPPSGVREAVLRAAQAATDPAPITETPRLWATLIGWLQSHARLTTLSVLAVIGLAVLSRRDPQHVSTPPLTPSAPDVLQEFAPTPAAPAADSVSPTREIEPTRATVPASPESVPPVEEQPSGGGFLGGAASGEQLAPAGPRRPRSSGAASKSRGAERKAARATFDKQEPPAPTQARPGAPALQPSVAPAGAADAVRARARELSSSLDEAPSAQPSAAPSARVPAAELAPPAAAPALEASPRAFPRSANELEARVAHAQAELEAGRMQQAVRAFEELLRDFPRDPRAPHWRLQLQRARGERR